MSFKYQSGEEVRAGDRIVYADDPGEVEFIADSTTAPDDWYVREYGGGVMIRTAKMGSVFLTTTEDEEDLDLVARGTTQA